MKRTRSTRSNTVQTAAQLEQLKCSMRDRVLHAFRHDNRDSHRLLEDLLGQRTECAQTTPHPAGHGVHRDRSCTAEPSTKMLGLPVATDSLPATHTNRGMHVFRIGTRILQYLGILYPVTPTSFCSDIERLL